MSVFKDQVSQEEIDREAGICANLVGRSLGAYLKTVALVSEAYLAQVLVALWDSGIYEYVRRHERIETAHVAAELNLNPMILQSLVEYLVGCGILVPDGGAFVLGEKGRPYWNYITRGVLTAHLAGYNPLLTNLGPLLRKEIELHDPRLDRVGRRGHWCRLCVTRQRDHPVDFEADQSDRRHERHGHRVRRGRFPDPARTAVADRRGRGV